MSVLTRLFLERSGLYLKCFTSVFSIQNDFESDDEKFLFLFRVAHHPGHHAIIRGIKLSVFVRTVFQDEKISTYAFFGQKMKKNEIPFKA